LSQRLARKSSDWSSDSRLTTGAIECLQEWGSEEQKEVYLRKLMTG
jgi:alkylation response protein AidB-like acyl-CoA dehydrogenase